MNKLSVDGGKCSSKPFAEHFEEQFGSLLALMFCLQLFVYAFYTIKL